MFFKTLFSRESHMLISVSTKEDPLQEDTTFEWVLPEDQEGAGPSPSYPKS